MCVILTGKTGEELMHEVAARYVEAMKDMEGRKPGPSSILGKTSFWSHLTSVYGSDIELKLCSFRGFPAKAWGGRGIQSGI